MPGDIMITHAKLNSVLLCATSNTSSKWQNQNSPFDFKFCKLCRQNSKYWEM